MSARKYGSGLGGAWTRDDNSLPCFDLEPGQLSRTALPLHHLLGTGRLSVLADQFGMLQVFTSETGCACRLTPAPAIANCGAFHVRLTHAESTRTFLLSELADAETPRLRCGIGYACYSGDVLFGNDTRVAVTLTVSAPPAQTLIVLRLTLRNLGAQAVTIGIAATAEIVPALLGERAANAGGFAKDGVAMFADLQAKLGDFYLAGTERWTGSVDAPRLLLEAEQVLDAGTECGLDLLLGYGVDRSLDWLQTARENWTADAANAAWAERLAACKLRAPELWMQEECLWAAGRLLAFGTHDAGTARCVTGAGGASLFVPAEGTAADVSGGLASRDLLALVLPLADREPGAALANLLAVTARQRSSGRVPERLDGPCAQELDPAVDRSDLEIWFLLAWAAYLAEQGDDAVLDQTCAFGDGGTAPVYEHVTRAYRWVREELRQGAHGLLRMLGGDWNAYLNGVGVAGKGESVLNSAMTCFALPRLVDCARRREDVRLADEMNAWHDELRLAVGDAFETKWFRRAYTDAGRPVGSVAEDRCFTAVQAWAVLARCGTAQQREQALIATLSQQQGIEPAITTMSRPYAAVAPGDVSNVVMPPGDRENAGVSLPVASWFVWALAAEGRTADALREWERLTLRLRASQTPDMPVGLLTNLAFVCSAHSTRRVGGPALGELARGQFLPDAHAVAWLEFALRRITMR